MIYIYIYENVWWSDSGQVWWGRTRCISMSYLFSFWECSVYCLHCWLSIGLPSSYLCFCNMRLNCFWCHWRQLELGVFSTNDPHKWEGSQHDQLKREIDWKNVDMDHKQIDSDVDMIWPTNITNEKIQRSQQKFSV